MARIMLVDDDENVLRALRRTLSMLDDEGSEDVLHNYIELFISPLKALKRAQEGVVLGSPTHPKSFRFRQPLDGEST